MALTKEQRNELLFLVLENLRSNPDHARRIPESGLTAEQRSKLPRLVDRVDAVSRSAETESMLFKLTSGPA